MVGGAKGVDGKARYRGYKRLHGWRTRFVSSRCFKMKDVALPEDFPYELRLDYCARVSQGDRGDA